MQYVTGGLVCPSRARIAPYEQILPPRKGEIQANPDPDPTKIVHSEQITTLGSLSGLVTQRLPDNHLTIAFAVVNFRNFTELPLAAGLPLAFGAALAAAALTTLAPLPTEAQSSGVSNSNSIGNGTFRGGNNGNGPNPSRGNAGRNSGATSVSNSVMTPTIRFAPPGRGFGGR